MKKLYQSPVLRISRFSMENIVTESVTQVTAADVLTAPGGAYQVEAANLTKVTENLAFIF